MILRFHQGSVKHWRDQTICVALLVSMMILSGSECFARVNADTEHVTTSDLAVVNDAFLHGYTHNEVSIAISGHIYPTLAIQCVNWGTHQPENPEAEESLNPVSSVWTRDLFWGYLGWTQAGDDHALVRMQSSLEVLLNCMHRNHADGHNKTWPLADGRYYIPQAFTEGGEIAEKFFPYCSESQADFLLLAHKYWQMTGDDAYIRRIWPDILYITETIAKMDSDGNGLPDQLWGSYDYQGLGRDTEEPLMCAKAAFAYRAVAEMSRALGDRAESDKLEGLAERVRAQMSLPVDKGGLWKPLPDGGGYFVNQRNHIHENGGKLDERFVPYENLVPVFCGITSKEQTDAIFAQLDSHFDDYYALKWGPLYIAPAGKAKDSVMTCSSAPWLGFLDVYLRCKLGHATNRSRIFKLLIDHAYDIPAAPFTEGAGIHGVLTRGAGRTWDNGNFFHCLINGIYGVQKDSNGLAITAPVKMEDFPLTELRNLHWHDAVYDLAWHGQGTKIKKVALDGKPVERSEEGHYLLHERTGAHHVSIDLFE